jgi:hypothetical protein
MAVKIVDPKTGARVADPNFVGVKTSSGGTGTSWPEVRSQYQKGKRSAEFDRPGVPTELKSYLTGKTNKLSEDFDEPVIRSGGDVSYTRTAKNKPIETAKEELSKLPVKNAKTAIKSATVKGPKTLNPVETKAKKATGWFNDNDPHLSGEFKSTNKQLKQFASYASKTQLGESFIGSPKSTIDQYKNEMKGQRRQYAKEGNVEGIKATTSEIRQARNASKFINSKNPLDVPGMATGYRASMDNAANRNTIKQQVKDLKGYGKKY